MPPNRQAALDELTAEFAEANESELPKYIPLKPGMKLKVSQGTKVFEGGSARRLAEDEEIPVPEGVKTLGAFAASKLGNADKAASLIDNNKDKLKPPENTAGRRGDEDSPTRSDGPNRRGIAGPVLAARRPRVVPENAADQPLAGTRLGLKRASRLIVV